MENASKALIIAGAILLAIVIISLGLIVVNNTRSTIDQTNLSEQEIQTFNSKFTPYEGTNISGSRVKTLIQTVRASNQANSDKQISFAYAASSTANANNNTIDEVTTEINTGSTYSVTLGYGTNSLVNKITIKKN